MVQLLKDRDAYRGVYDEIIIISPTFRLQNEWKSISGEGITVHDAFSEEVLSGIYNEKQKNPRRNSLLILDDNGDDLKKINQSIFNKLISARL